MALLQNVKGTLDIRLIFHRDIIKEILRFKRRNLAGLLEEYTNKLQYDGLVENHHTLYHNGATIR